MKKVVSCLAVIVALTMISSDSMTQPVLSESGTIIPYTSPPSPVVPLEPGPVLPGNPIVQSPTLLPHTAPGLEPVNSMIIPPYRVPGYNYGVAPVAVLPATTAILPNRVVSITPIPEEPPRGQFTRPMNQAPTLTYSDQLPITPVVEMTYGAAPIYSTTEQQTEQPHTRLKPGLPSTQLVPGNITNPQVLPATQIRTITTTTVTKSS